ncbi:UNVERIFIED_CONTAM: hypothetical protein FKN15_052111 [Acipenser sinensis]
MNRMMSNTSSMSSDSNLSISSSTPATEQVPARRNSIPGIKMPMWGNTRSLSSPATAKTGKDIFTFVVTPDRVPQFIIPPLDIQEDQRFFNKERAAGWQQQKQQHICFSQEDNYTSRVAPSSSLDCAPMQSRRARRSSSDPFTKGYGPPRKNSFPCPFPETDIPDPVTRAALSLPHLSKITTPYGFLTLGESPQVTNQEALFFQGHVPRPCGEGEARAEGLGRRRSREEQGVGCSSLDLKNNSSQGRSIQEEPLGEKPRKGVLKHSRFYGIDRSAWLRGLPDTEIEEEASESQPPTPQNPDRDGGSSQDPSPPQRRSRKISFRGLLKKHFASLKEMRFGMSHRSAASRPTASSH